MKMIMLESSDNRKFVISEAVARQLLTIRHITDNARTDKITIRVIDVHSEILFKVIMYCTKHVTMAKKIAWPHIAEEELKKLDAEFLDTDIDTLCDLILAASSLNIPSLFDGACQKVADMLMEKSPEEVLEIFKIENEFSSEEEEAIRCENAWVYT